MPGGASVAPTSLAGRLLDHEHGERDRETLEQALRLEPGLPEAQLRAVAYYLRNGDRDSANARWTQAVSLDPDNILGVSGRAGWAYGKGRLNEAIEL